MSSQHIRLLTLFTNGLELRQLPHELHQPSWSDWYCRMHLQSRILSFGLHLCALHRQLQLWLLPFRLLYANKLPGLSGVHAKYPVLSGNLLARSV